MKISINSIDEILVKSPLLEQMREQITRLEVKCQHLDCKAHALEAIMRYPLKYNESDKIQRDDIVHAFGLLWRVDWIDGGWLGISNDRGEHKEVHSNAVERISQMQGISEIRQQMVDDIVNQV
ncbi:MAG: hypothetical protein AB7D24_12575 [Sphaerochaeta sp.]|uniref:hypothetical protein n=1 Tax=Sphaerochaeta sp. TaxID=1972642 RepID=UPI003D0BB2EB